MVKMPICGGAWLAKTASSADTSCISTALHAQEEPSSQQSCSQCPVHCQHARPKLPISPRLTVRLVLHAADAFVPPPARYPHLHSAAFAAYSCAHLVAFYLGLLYCQWSIARTEPYHTPLDPAGAHAPYLVPAHQQRAKAA